MHLSDHTFHLIQLALAEDIGRGDCTTELVVARDMQAVGVVWLKEPARMAGLPMVAAVFQVLDPTIEVRCRVTDGDDVRERTAVCEIRGCARSVLMGERTALNFLARLAGIATHTKDAVTQLAGTRARLLDTRKTTPGWRVLEKYAVRMGGGSNHRFGLDDMILIKDNHIALAGGVREAVEKAKKGRALSQLIEVEVDTLEQLDAALQTAPDMILLDNMDVATLRRAVEKTAGRVKLEASGNMTMERLRDVAETGVDYISMGALTHAATSVDVGLDVSFDKPPA